MDNSDLWVLFISVLLIVIGVQLLIYSLTNDGPTECALIFPTDKSENVFTPDPSGGSVAVQPSAFENHLKNVPCIEPDGDEVDHWPGRSIHNQEEFEEEIVACVTGLNVDADPCILPLELGDYGERPIYDELDIAELVGSS